MSTSIDVVRIVSVRPSANMRVDVLSYLRMPEDVKARRPEPIAGVGVEARESRRRCAMQTPAQT